MSARKITQFVKKAATLSVLASGFVFSSLASADTVTIGYQGMMNPWKTVIAEKQLEKATGMDIEWRRFDSGAKVITAMASGDIDMASAGSSPIAAAVNRGLDIELIWILENINDAEALVVRDGSGISAPQDLRGKNIGVPFVSTTHFHMLFAMEQFGLTEKDVKLINMQPNAINAAWERGDIDAAFIWDPALGRIKQSGHVLFSSGDLSRWGKATFDGLVINKSFGEDKPEFVAQVIKLIADADSTYRAEKDSLTIESPMIKGIASMTGGAVENVAGVLALYDFPSLTEQTSCAWLGCGAEGGASKALQFTSEFLKEQGKVRALADDYSVFVNPSFAEAAAKL
ncbi:taurine ABC transporter substrate-binding protein [Amphritea sp. 2_MG-2023]|jgi:taurine transport system substrate-binding protein|uniref:taurine ABC transporter substrate-binding protein n=1 Tax=Amphritea TaxID=515417 RepID=UPI001C07D7F1|nr:MULTISPECIES: taurine ABC transporter substrate-binding protein [Amphritea]MBU2964249.1 taurine ABC transporter substrate-binding protein [Amphritea atlantica]MDO6419494.1 taurine ABC transporter substrate-binding protein [Amphritea sp. 2_MG-2023]